MNTLRFCRVCTSPTLAYLWSDLMGGQWYHCADCGSDSCSDLYRPGLYGPAYVEQMLRAVGSIEQAKIEVSTNVEWFDRFALAGTGRDFLDVGFAEGASMLRMQETGWRVHGFDVCLTNDAVNATVHPFLSASLFDRQFDAVLCREVIEHVDGWRGFLAELTATTKTGGLLQIQTPIPNMSNPPHVYQCGHLQIFSPASLEQAVMSHGFRILDRLLWDTGQALLLELHDRP